MPDENIEVISYSGYRDDEKPMSFILHNEKIRITKILDMWIEEGFHDRVRKRFFQISGSDGFIHKIYFVEKTKEWFICKK